jgi:hypothetical protein
MACTAGEKDHHLDAAGVHGAQPRVLDIEQPVAQLRPDMRAEHL